MVLRTLLFGIDLPSYASLMTAALFLGGVQIISMEVLGKYLGRTFEKAKDRPVHSQREIERLFRLDPLRADEDIQKRLYLSQIISARSTHL